MRFQSKGSISYMVRNFWHLVYITLPVSVLIAFFYNPTSEIELFLALVKGELNADNYMSCMGDALTVLRFGRYWWVSLLSVVILAFAMSMMVVKIDRHMRIGQMVSFPFKRTFGIFPYMLAYVFGWLIVTEIGILIPIGIAYMLSFVRNVTVVVSITLSLIFICRGFLTYLFCLLIISFPLKYSENYRFNIALAYSARAMSTKRRLIWGLAVLFPVCRVSVMALGYLLAPFGLDVLIYALAAVLSLIYVPCLAFKQYYDDVGGERRDISQIMFG